jgi:hypothetical protein
MSVRYGGDCVPVAREIFKLRGVSLSGFPTTVLKDKHWAAFH